MISMLLFLLLVTEAGGRLIVLPENAAVISGSQVTLRCQTDSESVIWKILPRNTISFSSSSSSSSSTTVFTGNKIANDFNTSYAISKSTDKNGEFNLLFKASRETAAIYRCEEAGVESASAELIVIASKPKCSVESNWVECRVDFWGNWVPILEWQIITGIGTADRKVNLALAKGVEVAHKNDSLVSTLYLNDNRRIGGETGYSCTLRFTESGRPKTLSARNVPTYSYTWKRYEETSTVSSGFNDGKTRTTVIVCLVVLMMIVAALSVYIVHTKRKQARAPGDGRRESEDVAAVELSNLPMRTSAVESEYVSLPTKDKRCPPAQRLTCSGDYSALRNEDYTKLEVYAVLDV